MRRSYRSLKPVRGRVVDGVQKEGSKEGQKGAKEQYGKFVKEVVLNPQFPRLMLLAIGGGSAITYYITNGSNLNMNKSGKKKTEAVGNITVERYTDRLSKYATSLELATNYTGSTHLDSRNIASVNSTIELQQQLGRNVQFLVLRILICL